VQNHTADREFSNAFEQLAQGFRWRFRALGKKFSQVRFWALDRLWPQAAVADAKQSSSASSQRSGARRKRIFFLAAVGIGGWKDTAAKGRKAKLRSSAATMTIADMGVGLFPSPSIFSRPPLPFLGRDKMPNTTSAGGGKRET
jgi:hypothetical protein